MSKYEFLIALISVVVGGTTIASVVSSITKVFIKRNSTSSLSDGTAARIDDRLSRMEQAIDAMAVEMERISEGQRFTTKLLAERSGASGDARNASIERVPGRPNA